MELTHEFECRACNGEGERYVTAPGLPRAPHPSPCEDCDGTGWVKCDRGGVGCRFSHCYCEAAWEAQEADRMSEPPMSADERHRMAWEEREALRAGRPL